MKRIFIYLITILIALIVNYFLLNFTADFIGKIVIYLNNHLKFIHIESNYVFSLKPFAELLLFNLISLLSIVFVIIGLFYRRINKLLDKSNLFTIKKIFILGLVIIGIQILITIYIWHM